MTSDVPCALSLSELVLKQVSPAEVPLVEAIGPQILAAGGRRGRTDGALGMGVDEFTWLVAVLPVTNAVVDFLVERAKEVAADEVKQSTTALLAWLREFRGKPAADRATNPPILSPDLAVRVREVAYQKSLAGGVDTARARLIADAIVGAVGMPDKPTG